MFIRGSLLCLAVMAGATASRGALIATESFNYTSGPINGLGTDAGWSATGQTWRSTSTSNVADGDRPLSYGTLSKTNEHFEVGGNNQPAFRNYGAVYTTTGHDYWFSTLIRTDQGGTTSYGGISLYNANDQAASEQFFYGLRNGSGKWGMEQHAMYGSQHQGDSTTIATAGQTSLLVMELNGTTDKAYLWVNPTATLAGANPDIATASVTLDLVNFNFDRIRVQSGSTNVIDVDELRFGTTYGDVTPSSTPVPEPSGVMLPGLGVLGMMLIRRRKPITC